MPTPAPILARRSAAGLVVKSEIQKVPMHQEPEESHTAGGEQRVPDFVPKPLLLISPRLDCGNDRKQGPGSAQHSDHLQQMELPGAFCSQFELLQKSEHPNETNQIDDIDDAGNLRPATPLASAFIEGQGLSVIPAQHGRHGPKENGKHNYDTGAPDDDVIEHLLVKRGVHFLNHDKRKVQVAHKAACAVFYESDLFGAIDTVEKHGSNLPKMPGLAVFLLELRDVNGVVLGIGKNLGLSQHGSQSQNIRFKAAAAFVRARDPLRVLFRGGERGFVRGRAGKVAVHEFDKQVAARVAVVGAAGAVVGHKQPYIRVQQQKQITVK